MILTDDTMPRGERNMTLVLVLLGAWLTLSTLFALLLGPALRTCSSSGSTSRPLRGTTSLDERVPALGGVR